MKTNTPAHRKTRRLTKALGIRLAEAVGILALIWNYAKREAKDGDLSVLTPEELAEEAGWEPGDAAVLCAALHGTAWLDKHPTREGYIIHDWFDHCETYVIRDLTTMGRLPSGWTRGNPLPDGFYGSAEPRTAAQNGAEHSTTKSCSPTPSPSPSPSPSRTVDACASTAPTVSQKTRKRSKPDSTDGIAWTRSGGWTGIDEADNRDWRSAYPAVDLDRQLAVMTEWLKANPEKAHKRRWRRFITNWLSRSQERGGDIGRGVRTSPRAGNDYHPDWAPPGWETMLTKDRLAWIREHPEVAK